MGVMGDAERVEPDALATWSGWLAAHHADAAGAWLVSARREADRAFPYEEAVVEALRWGWVDSTQRPVDAARASGMWTLMDDVEDLVVPPDLAAALERHRGARRTRALTPADLHEGTPGSPHRA